MVGLNEASLLIASFDDFNQVTEISATLEISETQLALLKEQLKLFLKDATMERAAADLLFRQMFTESLSRKLCEPTTAEIEAVTVAEVTAALQELRPRGHLHVVAPVATKISDLRKFPRLEELAARSPSQMSGEVEGFFVSKSSDSTIYLGEGEMKKAVVLVGGEVDENFDAESSAAELLQELREDRSLVYDVQVMKNELGSGFFAVAATHVEPANVEELKRLIEAKLKNKLKIAHVVVAQSSD
jgi:hypothetical protein